MPEQPRPVDAARSGLDGLDFALCNRSGFSSRLLWLWWPVRHHQRAQVGVRRQHPGRRGGLDMRPVKCIGIGVRPDMASILAIWLEEPGEWKMRARFVVLPLSVMAALAFAAPASAQSGNEYMRHECERVAQQFYRDYEAGSNTTLSRRTDRTYGVNGEMYLENRSGIFACSFAADGRTMVQFYADGAQHNGYLPGAGATRQVRVRFSPGSSQTTLTASVAGGHSVRYVLNARARQDLYARIQGSGLNYRIINPDSTTLLDPTSTNREYRGQLWQSGDHIIEVINNGSSSRYFTATFSITAGGAATQLPGGTASQLPGDQDTWYTRLVGANGEGAATQLRNRGFTQVDSFDSGRNGYGAVWYSRASRLCLQVITVNGRVDSARDIRSHPRCR